MKRLSFLFIALLFTGYMLFPLYSFAEEPIPRDDFIKITDAAFDALDEVETILSNGESMKIEVKIALDKLNTANKRYSRFVSGKWPEGEQQKVVAGLAICTLSWEIVSMNWTL